MTRVVYGNDTLQWEAITNRQQQLVSDTVYTSAKDFLETGSAVSLCLKIEKRF